MRCACGEHQSTDAATPKLWQNGCWRWGHSRDGGHSLVRGAAVVLLFYFSAEEAKVAGSILTVTLRSCRPRAHPARARWKRVVAGLDERIGVLRDTGFREIGAHVGLDTGRRRRYIEKSYTSDSDVYLPKAAVYILYI